MNAEDDLQLPGDARRLWLATRHIVKEALAGLEQGAAEYRIGGGTSSYNSLWPNSICITPGPDPVMFTQDMLPGRIYKMSLDGTVLGYFGRDGQAVGEFGWIHGLACPSPSEVWVAELLTWRVQKITLRD